MTLNILFASTQKDWGLYAAPLRAAFDAAGITAQLHRDLAQPEAADYLIFTPSGPVEDFAPFTRARAVMGLWAGVEVITTNPTLSQPLTRMVDPGLTEGMVEWVTGHVLRHHLGLDAQICQQDGQWQTKVPPLARDRRVTILGLGALGSACAQALGALNFNVTGWSMSQKDLPGVRCLSGPDNLNEALSEADFLVLLLPLTPQTSDLIDAGVLACLPKGAVLLNPGRGGLIDDGALLAALECGQIGHATLDVFRTEPLPETDPYWAHPNVTVTAHIASATRASTAAHVIAQNILRDQAGQPMLHLVDRARGY